MNATDAAVLEASRHAEGSGNHTAAWRVNGALVYARGANVVPMEEVEGRASAAATVRMLRTAADGGMNTLRIWAGAIYFHEAFFRAADSLGLMIYHDLMYIEQGHGPLCPFYACASGWSCAGNQMNSSTGPKPCEAAKGGAVMDTQRAELQHNLRRLGSHPSIVVRFSPPVLCLLSISRWRERERLLRLTLKYVVRSGTPVTNAAASAYTAPSS